MPLGGKVDRTIKAIESNVTPRDPKQTKEGAAIAIAKSRGLLRQKGKHLALGYASKGN